jgi:hypothetical protein
MSKSVLIDILYTDCISDGHKCVSELDNDACKSLKLTETDVLYCTFELTEGGV